MLEHRHDRPTLVFRKPLPLYLGELVLTVISLMAIALLLLLVIPDSTIFVLAAGGVVCFLRAWHHRAGTVKIRGSTVFLRRGFFPVQEVPFPIQYTHVRFRQNIIAQLFDWATVRARFQDCDVEIALVGQASILHWVLSREREHLGTSSQATRTYSLGSREVSLLPAGEDSDWLEG